MKKKILCLAMTVIMAAGVHTTAFAKDYQGADGWQVHFTGDKMEFSALPYTPHELENAMHPYELPQVHYTVVRVAKQQMGVGGDDSWGAPVSYTHLTLPTT
mgnify:CR=1 FL=1